VFDCFGFPLDAIEGNCFIGTARPTIVVEEEVNRGFAAIDAQRNREEA
jgi:hypothetical protein